MSATGNSVPNSHHIWRRVVPTSFAPRCVAKQLGTHTPFSLENLIFQLNIKIPLGDTISKDENLFRGYLTEQIKHDIVTLKPTMTH